MMLSTLFMTLPFPEASFADLSPCHSFGIDYRDGGSYFLESSRSVSFTALQYFTGCQNDVAENLLIDPSGNEKRCNRTPMQPEGVAQRVDCGGIQVYTGDWSILVLSYNGGAEPIMDQRDFHLSVGEQDGAAATPSRRTECYGMPAQTMTVISFAWRFLSVDMSGDFEPSSTAVAGSSHSALTSNSINFAVASAVSTSALIPCHRPAETMEVYLSTMIDQHSRNELPPPVPTSSTIEARSALDVKGSSVSKSIETFTPVQQKSGRFRKSLSIGWRPSNIWRHAAFVEQSRTLEGAYAIMGHRADMPIVTIFTATFMAPLQSTPSVGGQLKLA
ncbi:hypothetical protein PRZ48_007398 [Zasmidium cellare]|uniref:Uncharacterized protein n=1 Tax=Zasmidium cellare TaxID=395010 RepID=A0ABR0EJ82_ZASCE|nr:hypothetical protein PRZ48_007398 [Zasmidium cellare]